MYDPPLGNPNRSEGRSKFGIGPYSSLHGSPSAVEIGSGLEVYTRHLEKKERGTHWIASGFYPMRRTEENMMQNGLIGAVWIA